MPGMVTQDMLAQGTPAQDTVSRGTPLHMPRYQLMARTRHIHQALRAIRS